MALAEAGEAARGATALCHARALRPSRAAVRPAPTLLIAAGVARVVAAIGDPDPRVDGKGFEQLRAAGIEVETGPGADRGGAVAWPAS